jgi:hypothetical protein
MAGNRSVPKVHSAALASMQGTCTCLKSYQAGRTDPLCHATALLRLIWPIFSRLDIPIRFCPCCMSDPHATWLSTQYSSVRDPGVSGG